MKTEFADGLTPEEALEYFQSKVPLPPDLYFALDAAYRDSAFSIARVEEELLIETAKAGLERAIAEGASESAFAKYLDEAFDAAGVGRLGKHHLETVFNTNVMSSYSAGRYEGQTDPDVVEKLPWFEFRTASGDPCPVCQRMNGFRAPKDDPIWDTHYPPLHHNCMCGVYSIPAPDDGRRSSTENLLPPAEGFDVRPGSYHGTDKAEDK